VTTHSVNNPARHLKYAALAIALGLTACVAPSQPFLDNARTICSSGDQVSCGQVPMYQAQVNAEHSEQAAEVAAGILAGIGAAAAGAAAGYAAAHPAPVYYAPVVICRWNCW
jgi:hypothetical protein